MIRLISKGKFTKDYTKALMGAPEDREPVVRKLFEASGAKLIAFYVTTGDSDFLTIVEGPDSESILAAMMAAAASGTISDVSTVRAWTGSEFKVIAEKAGKAAGSYRAPGKK